MSTKLQLEAQAALNDLLVLWIGDAEEITVGSSEYMRTEFSRDEYDEATRLLTVIHSGD